MSGDKSSIFVRVPPPTAICSLKTSGNNGDYRQFTDIEEMCVLPLRTQQGKKTE
jgi:hypothetical protein